MDTTTTSPKLSSNPKLSGNNAALLAVALSLGAVICGAAAGAASAQTTGPASEAVSIADLDLSTADGARTMLKRIDIAAQRACGGEPSRSPLLPRASGLFEQCVREAVATAVRNADQPMVAEARAEAITLAAR